MAEMIDTIQGLIDRFNEKAEKDEEFRNYWRGKVRSISVAFTDGGQFSFHLREARLVDLKPEGIAEPNIKITTDTETFIALIEKRMGAMKALALRKVSVKATLEDMLAIRKLL
jgi:putative sterol carrier protein